MSLTNDAAAVAAGGGGPNNQDDEETSGSAPATQQQQQQQRGLYLNDKFETLLKGSSSILTRAKFFERLAHWAFTVCDGNGTGQVNKDELYAGLLLVHVNLAKYVGAAACYPPRRPVVEALFNAFDVDHSGYISKDEFLHILQICSVDIASRIAVYFAILILLVPYLADALIHAVLHVDDYFGWHMMTKTQVTVFQWIETILSWNQIAEQILGLLLLFLIIPILFGLIDQKSTEHALALAANETNTTDMTNVDDMDKKKNE
ncbi:hypothetical protein ACA910_002481 [Epithemia clementina (nom. ined.)]